MSTTRGFKHRHLPFILLAGLIGIALTVVGGLIAQERNIDQYAAQQVDHQIDWITNHPEPYDPAGETTLADWVANKVGRAGLDRSDMVFSVNTAGEDVTKLGSGVPELAQSGLLLDADARTQILTPGEGRVSSAVGDFYHRTVNFNVGNETVALASLVYLGGLEQVQGQTRNSMALLGLGGFLILALVAANLLGGKRVVDADQVPHDDDPDETRRGQDTGSAISAGSAPRRTSALGAMPAKHKRDDLADRSKINTGDLDYDARDLPAESEELAPTERHDVARESDATDVDAQATDEHDPVRDDAPAEVRASGVWSWAEDEDRSDSQR